MTVRMAFSRAGVAVVFVLVGLWFAVASDITVLKRGECEESECEHLCRSVDGVPLCQCYPGFQLDPDGKTCGDINECLDETSSCPQDCVNTPGSYKCLCPDGTPVNPKKKDTCNNVERGTTPKTTQDLHLPRVRSGRVQPPSISQMNIRRTKHYFPKHQHLSQVTVEQSAKGSAPKLKITRKQTFEEKYEDVVDISIPLLPHMTMDSTKKLTNFVQSALDEADARERKCEGEECLCKRGYRLASDGKTCIDLNECMNGQANCSPGRCMNTIGSARCICPEGFVQSARLECLDVDECTLPDLPCSQTCINIPGAFRCGCYPDHRLQPDGTTCLPKPKTNESEPPSRHDDPIRISMKSVKTINGTKQTILDDQDDSMVQESLKWLQLFSNFYSDSLKAEKESEKQSKPREEKRHGRKVCQCNNGGICVGGKCICSQGYQGRRCQHDVDECGGAHSCSQTCVNTQGSYQCACSDGYVLESDGTSCTQLPCKKGCLNGGTCVNSGCVCRKGFSGAECEKDVDECFESVPCDQICRNTVGSYECDCTLGFQLEDDKKSCRRLEEEVEESRPVCDPQCVNEGVCKNGTCECAEGFTGRFCEVKQLRDSLPETESYPSVDPPSETKEEDIGPALSAFERPVVYKLLPHSNRLEALSLLQENTFDDKTKDKEASRERNNKLDETEMGDTPFTEEEEDDPNSVAHPSAAFYFNPEHVTTKLTSTTPRTVNLASTGNRTCYFQGRGVASGERFFRDDANCTRCVCQDGDIRCQPRHCSRSSCSNPTKGQCCDYCPNDCIVEHQVYRNGMSFISDLDPCRSCTCVEGRVLCDDIRCPPLECEPQYRVLPGDRCCSECFAPEPGCFHRSRFYYKGQLWVDHSSRCQTCLCKDEGNVQCNPIVCVAECTNPIFKSGDCCPRCDAGCQVGHAIYADGDKFLHADDPCLECRCHGGNVTCVEIQCKKNTCSHDGREWRKGEKFHLNDDPCSDCSCAAGGQVQCKVLECDTKCLHGVLMHDKCCPMCDGCDYLGIIHTNGETFGLTEQGGELKCTCTNGTVDCTR